MVVALDMRLLPGVAEVGNGHMVRDCGGGEVGERGNSRVANQ